MITNSIRILGAFLLMTVSILSTKAQVTLKDNGTTVTISNGIVSAIVEKDGAKVTTLTLNGSPNLLGGKGDYYTTHVTRDTLDYWLGIGGTYSVITNTTDMVDIAFHNPTMGSDATYPKGLFDVTKHFVMRKGEAGYYNYMVWKHAANQPAAGYYQQRTTVSGNGTYFNSSATHTAYSYSGKEKMGQSIDWALCTNDITNAVYQLPKTSSYKDSVGFTEDHFPVWTKYDWAVYSGDSTSYHNTWGAADDQYGIWRLCPSEEFLNGGPTKLRGGVQGGEVDLNTNEGHGIGYVDNSVGAGVVWQKMYGPFFVYVNKGTNHTQLWNDANAQGIKHVAAWPYTWVNESQTTYPTSRGIVKGAIYVNGKVGANAVVILGNKTSAAGDTGINWMFQGGTNYLFWTKADASGNFSIPKVRPGTYRLFSFVPGTFEELHIDNVVITASKTTNLGKIMWTPPTRTQQIWRIGTPDHSAGEFRWGWRMRQFGLWWRYLEERGQKDLTYVIGKSKPEQDWYYAQPIVAVDGGGYFAPNWNVQFTLDAIPPAPAIVRLALSGGMQTAMYIGVNGTNILGGYKGIYTEDDAAYYRDNIKVGQYQYYEAQFDPKLLKIGTNIVTVSLRKTASNTWTYKPVLPGGGIQYDCIALEAGPLGVRDCNGEINGKATHDNCDRCIGGTTGKTACSSAGEAETDACNFVGITETKNTGYKGSSYINGDQAIGASITFNVLASSPGNATLSFRYANGKATDRTAQISVNGTILPNTLNFPVTGTFADWETVDITLPLVNGVNVVKLISSTADGLANIDQIGYVSSGLSKGNCLITAIDNSVELTGISIYPNPFTESLTIQQSGEFSYQILGLDGKELETGKGNDMAVIGEALPNGTYVLKIQSANNQRVVKINKAK